MKIVAHQDDCQMVTGNIVRFRTPKTLGQTHEPNVALGTKDEDRSMPRQCTCEPFTVDLDRIEEAIAHVRNTIRR